MYFVFFSSSALKRSRFLLGKVPDLSLVRKTVFLSLKSLILAISLRILSLCSSSSIKPSSSSILSTTYLLLISPVSNFSPILNTSLIETEKRNMADIVSRAPSSIFLAISTSPSRLKRETDPISRKYIFTGSPVFSALGTSASASLRITSPISFIDFFTVSFSPCSVSMISIFFSPKSIIISSICSEDVTSGSKASLTSS